MPSLRKLIGTFLMLFLVIFYALFAMAVAEGRVTDAPAWLQPILYALLGLAWVLPAMGIIKWMEKPVSRRKQGWFSRRGGGRNRIDNRETDAGLR